MTPEKTELSTTDNRRTAVTKQKLKLKNDTQLNSGYVNATKIQFQLNIRKAEIIKKYATEQRDRNTNRNNEN
ncbi:CLUMA_CG005795, isoform A [Clunio marinus]|uniref:CLUMA_CG005795, isoform A n=1 Tax=Clunio marinus TaxID=568069 RepID=A0A1J1HXD8_9DIPT|nr:CLUMA_CG005795, isoform A [Clunio marinus]